MLYDLARIYFRPAGLTGAWTSLTGMGPETPAICPDTPGLYWFSYSEFMSKYSGLGVRILREYIRILRIFYLESHTGQTGLTGSSRADSRNYMRIVAFILGR